MQFTDNIGYITKVFLSSFIITTILTPISIKLAKKIGAVDIPLDARRMHTRAIPRFGGISIFIGSVSIICFYVGFERNIKIAILGGTLIYFLGALDDLRNLSAKFKFMCQFGVAVIMYILGLRITFITNYFGEGLWGLSSVICFFVTTIWIVGVTNTINLIDGLDGLAAGASAIIALSLAYVAYIHGEIFGVSMVYISLTAIAGACIGFLPYNFSPAKTFMGDGGSLYLGFMIAIMSVISPLKQATVISMSIPVIALAVPIFDTLSAMIRRKIRKQPIMSPDKEHLHHKLIASGYDQKRSVIMLYGITALMGMCAVLTSRELYKDAIIIFFVVCSYLYVFATDSIHKKEKIKEKEIAKKILNYFDNIYKDGRKQLEKDLIEAVKKEKKMFIVTANPETFMYGIKNEKVDEILSCAETTVVPDGIGIVKAAKILGKKCEEKIPGIDLTEYLLNIANEEKKSIYMLGSKPDILENMLNVIKEKYTNLRIAGYNDGYNGDRDEIFKNIINLQPDIILVALGIPAQELLISKHYDKFDKGIFVGVGGTFDVMSGNKKRAPKLFIKCNLEWLYRIVREPQRIKRFYKGNVKFIFLIRKINELR